MGTTECGREGGRMTQLNIASGRKGEQKERYRDAKGQHNACRTAIRAEVDSRNNKRAKQATQVNQIGKYR
eukprot:9049112-Heterocapsa_arctica.AAC.2